EIRLLPSSSSLFVMRFAWMDEGKRRARKKLAVEIAHQKDLDQVAFANAGRLKRNLHERVRLRHRSDRATRLIGERCYRELAMFVASEDPANELGAARLMRMRARHAGVSRDW